jgi:hypothetical protein
LTTTTVSVALALSDGDSIGEDGDSAGDGEDDGNVEIDEGEGELDDDGELNVSVDKGMLNDNLAVASNSRTTSVPAGRSEVGCMTSVTVGGF